MPYKDPEKRRQASKRRRTEHPELAKTEARAAYASLRSDPIRWKKAVRRAKLRVYSLTPEEWDRMFAAQNGVCKVCRRPESVVIKGQVCRLAIDHDHRCCPGKFSCGKCIRGLLCSPCNRAARLLDDDPLRARALADYLERSSIGRNPALFP